MKCALTGHRVLERNFSCAALEEKCRELIAQGADTFYCGMALGFDLVCCGVLASLKREFSIKIVACIPCADQSSCYPYEMRRLYEDLLRECDETIVLHERYEAGCMFERNRYMVDCCDVLLAYLYAERGGTWYTVKYALKKGKKIIYIHQKGEEENDLV